MKVWDGLVWRASNGFDVDDATGEFSFNQLMSVRTLESFGTGANSYLRLPQDDDAARSAIVANRGMIRFNTTTLVFEGYDGTDWNSFAFGGGDITFVDLTATGDTILGDNCLEDTLTINSVTSINCDTTIGANNTNTLSVVSVISSDLIPDGVSRTLGSASARWQNIHSSAGTFAGGDITLNADGSASYSAGNISLNVDGSAAYAGDIDPTVDNTQNLGQPTLRWANVYAGNVVADNITGSFEDLTVTGDTAIGNNCATDTLTITAATTVGCDMTIGSASTDSVSFVSGVATNLLPSADNAVDLGSPTQRWANVYTGDLHFSNEGSDGNDIDGTTGNWTLQEGDENMYFINNKTGAKFRVVMESVG